MARLRKWTRRLLGVACVLLAVRLLLPWHCGREADAWYRGDGEVQRALAEELVRFEEHERSAPTGDRFVGEWALVTHQMIAIGNALLLALLTSGPELAP